MSLVIKTPVGTINGINTDFTLPVGQTYASGTLKHLLNGVTVDPTGDDGLIELTNTTFRIKEAPLTGDVLLIIYDDGAETGFKKEVTAQINATNYQISYNVDNYVLEFLDAASGNAFKINYNIDKYSLDYNTNTYKIEVI